MLVNILLVTAVCLSVCDCTAHQPAHNVTHVNQSEVLHSHRLHRRQAHQPAHNVTHVNHSEVLRSHRLRRSSGPRPLTPQEKTKALYLHNVARAKEKAANMNWLTWNENLAKLAAEWAAECNWTHDMAKDKNNEYTYKRYFTSKPTQNLYATNREGFSLRWSIFGEAGWYGEKAFYDYTTTKCRPDKKCGHYTAMTWGNVSEVGCDRHYCSPFVKPPEDYETYTGWYLVCHYYPPGNIRYMGKDNNPKYVRPFKKGPVCSKCDKAWCRKDGLCNSECTGPGPDCVCKAICHNCGTLDEESCSCKCPPGFMGADCSEICENKQDKSQIFYRCVRDDEYNVKGITSSTCYGREGSGTSRVLCPVLCKLCDEDKSAEPGLCEPVIYTRPTDDPRLTDDAQATLPGNTTVILLNDTDPRNSSETSDASTSKLTTMTTIILLMTMIVLAISHHSAL